jgi:hypothetical protein
MKWLFGLFMFIFVQSCASEEEAAPPTKPETPQVNPNANQDTRSTSLSLNLTSNVESIQEKMVTPLCISCHAGKKPAAKLDLTDLALYAKDHSAHSDGDHGKVSAYKGKLIVPGKPDQSMLIKVLASKNPKVMMPPPSTKKTISAEDIEAVKEWIEHLGHEHGH